MTIAEDSRNMTSDKVRVMHAYREGRTIDYFDKEKPRRSWRIATYPTWNWSRFDYRIRPQIDPFAELRAAYEAGKTIQLKNRFGGVWNKLYSPIMFNLPVERYRVKPEPRYRDWTPQEAVGKKIKKKGHDKYAPCWMIIAAGIEGVWISYGTTQSCLDYPDLRRYAQPDDSKCGVKID